MRTIPVIDRPRPFRPAQVTLAPGVVTRPRDQILHLARVFPADRILAVFRANAGLPTHGAQPPGAWEDFGHPQEQAWGPDDYPGREHAQTANLLRGHYAGHFLSMLSVAAATTGDPALHAKVATIVDGLGEVRQRLAATGRYSHPGFLAAYGEWQFSRLEELAPYGEIWAPYYTAHKILAGLLDAHEHTGNAEALQLAAAMGEWIDGRLARVPAEQRERMWSLYIAGEFGGLGEALMRLAERSARPEFVDTARLFDQQFILDAGAQRHDLLDDVHANQHLPQLLSYLRLADVTGDQRYADAVAGLWDMVVPGRIYAHGGTGEGEVWGPAGAVAGDIGSRNAETCATYNLVKIGRELFARTEDAAYLDYVERGLLNQIVGSKRDVDSDVSPEVCYMFPVHAGAVREYDNVGTCCGGTGLENHVGYQDAIYLHRDGPHGREIWVNLHLPSRVSWPDQQIVVSQQTSFPRDGRVHIQVDATGPLTVHLRIPPWASEGYAARLNGEPVTDVDGGFLRLRRHWHPGDVIDIDLPMPVRPEATVDDPRLLALRYGPTVLLADSERTTGLTLSLAGHLLLDGSVDPRAVRHLDDDTVVVDGVTFEPCWSGSTARYHMYFRPHDPRIVFSGSDSGVDNRIDATGTTFLAQLWDRAPFADRDHFLRAVQDVAGQFRAAGLLTRAELTAVQHAAAHSDLGRTGMPLTVVLPAGDPVTLPATLDRAGDQHPVRWAATPDAARAGVHRVRGELDDGTVVDATVWVVESSTDAEDPPPAVTIDLTPDPAPSGWFVEPVTVTVTGRSDHAGLLTEVRLDDGPWRTVDGPLLLEQDGMHHVAARATDSTGQSAHVECTVSLDLTPPKSFAKVKNLGSSVEITLLAEDGGSGVDRIQWQTAGTFRATFSEAFTRALTDSEQIIEFAATDRAGNVEPVQRLVLPAATPES